MYANLTISTTFAEPAWSMKKVWSQRKSLNGICHSSWWLSGLSTSRQQKTVQKMLKKYNICICVIMCEKGCVVVDANNMYIWTYDFPDVLQHSVYVFVQMYMVYCVRYSNYMVIANLHDMLLTSLLGWWNRRSDTLHKRNSNIEEEKCYPYFSDTSETNIDKIIQQLRHDVTISYWRILSDLLAYYGTEQSHTVHTAKGLYGYVMQIVASYIFPCGLKVRCAYRFPRTKFTYTFHEFPKSPWA